VDCERNEQSGWGGSLWFCFGALAGIEGVAAALEKANFLECMRSGRGRGSGPASGCRHNYCSIAFDARWFPCSYNGKSIISCSSRFRILKNYSDFFESHSSIVDHRLALFDEGVILQTAKSCGPSAADLKVLQRLLRVRHRNFKSKAALEILNC
jgi:hypothetical protein